MPSLDLRNHAIPLFFFFFFFLDTTRNGDFISEMYGSLLLKCPYSQTFLCLSLQPDGREKLLISGEVATSRKHQKKQLNCDFQKPAMLHSP